MRYIEKFKVPGDLFVLSGGIEMSVGARYTANTLQLKRV